MSAPTILVVAPGAAFSTLDVFEGVCMGLSAAGAHVVKYALHGRLGESERALKTAYRLRKKVDKTIPKPTFSDIAYHASLGLYEKGYRFEPDAVLFVSGVLMTHDHFRLMRKRHPVAVLLTESPYLMAHEKKIAALADLAWTHERSALDELRTVQPRTHYLPHAWFPPRHGDGALLPDMPAHDVVFVGTDFKERIELLEAVDWTGIDLGLYGNWSSVAKDSPLQPFIRDVVITNAAATALYRRAKVCLNLYRTTSDFSAKPIEHAESLNPRAYELAAVGAFAISSDRAEVTEKFGDLVPTFSTARELETLIREWVRNDVGRARVAAQLPACVAGDHWLARGRHMLDDLNRLRTRAA